MPLIFLYTLTCPAYVPLPSLEFAPIATVLPSLLSETELPDRSPAASPSISEPCCVQVPLESLYILTWPAPVPLPSLPSAPMATVLPSLLSETEDPEPSPAASPSISEPCWIQVPLESLYILTWPAFEPLPPLPSAPMATVLPSPLSETEDPEPSPAASPSISEPCCVQVPLESLYILTWPAFEPLPSLL